MVNRSYDFKDSNRSKFAKESEDTQKKEPDTDNDPYQNI